MYTFALALASSADDQHQHSYQYHLLLMIGIGIDSDHQHQPLLQHQHQHHNLKNLKSKAMEGINDESAINTASFPLAQTKARVEHVILKQDAFAHPDY